MTAAVAYYLRLVGYRQSALPPVLLYLGLLGMIFATDAGPPVSAATVTSAALMPLSAWLARLAALSESRPFADMTAVALAGSTRRLLARTAAATVVGAGLTLVALVWARVASPHHPYDATTVLIVVGMHLSQVLAGVGVGALVAPPLRVTAGGATVAITVVVLLSLVIRWMPPIAPMLYNLDRNATPGATTLLLVIGQAAVVGCLALTAAAVLGRRAG